MKEYRNTERLFGYQNLHLTDPTGRRLWAVSTWARHPQRSRALRAVTQSCGVSCRSCHTRQQRRCVHGALSQLSPLSLINADEVCVGFLGHFHGASKAKQHFHNLFCLQPPFFFRICPFRNMFFRLVRGQLALLFLPFSHGINKLTSASFFSFLQTQHPFHLTTYLLE